MTWGILEPRSCPAHVPGTVLLESDFQQESNPNRFNVKKTVHRGETIVLVPQPSDDPNDPLNWSLWQKDLILLLYATTTILTVGGIGPIISPIAFELTLVFEVSFTKVSLLTGYSLLATACFGLVVSPVARKYGRRSPLIFSITCAFAGCLWAGYADSYNSLLGARILQGLGVSLFESLSFVIVGDLYFVHERGIRVALVTTAIIGVGALPPVVAGKVAMTMGWRWLFWLLSIFMGVILLWAIILGFETAYTRSPVYNTDTDSRDVLNHLEEKNIIRQSGHFEETNSLGRTEIVADVRVVRKPYVVRLKLWSGSYSSAPLWRLVFQPFLVIWSPAVVWAVLLFSFPVVWLVSFNLLIAQIFAGPPYLLNTAQLGYMSAGTVIGGVLATCLCAAVSDPIIKFCARKNGGVHEPEFRLLLSPLALVLTIVAYFPFGYMIRDGKSPVAIAAVYGIATASAQVCMAVVGSYVIDAYRDISVEVFMSTMIAKNILFYGFSYFINSWITRWGTVKFFCTVGAIQVVLCATTIVLYVFGKRLRFSWHRSGVNA